jgi:hypothetical protein
MVLLGEQEGEQPDDLQVLAETPRVGSYYPTYSYLGEPNVTDSNLR